MVKIRLTRLGKKRSPFYRIVAVDQEKKRDGAYIEQIGTYNPLKKETKISREVALKWLGHGAKPTETVANLFDKQGITKEFRDSKKPA